MLLRIQLDKPNRAGESLPLIFKNMIEIINPTCTCFQKHIANSCLWMRTTTEKQILLMPYFLNNNEEKIRYNFCPVCGSETRNLEAKRNENI